MGKAAGTKIYMINNSLTKLNTSKWDQNIGLQIQLLFANLVSSFLLFSLPSLEHLSVVERDSKLGVYIFGGNSEMNRHCCSSSS